MTLGERIVYYRKKAGFNQKGLAEALGISATRLNYYEKDKREPDIKMINALCKALNVDGDTLLGRETQVPEGLDNFTYAAHKYAGDLRPEDKDTIIKMMQTLAAANREGDPNGKTD